MSNIINHIRNWYNILRSLPPDVRDAAIGAIDRAAYLYQQFPPNESDAEYESRMMKLDKTLDDALDAMEESMNQKQPIIKQGGSSRKRVRKQFKKSKSKYTTRRRQ
jgi:hypothetical protein